MLLLFVLTKIFIFWRINWSRPRKCDTMITFANLPKNNASVIAFGVKDIGPYYWVGNCKNGVDYYAGQTFLAPASGVLKRIKLFSSVVFGSSDATLSIYKFNIANHTFEEKKSETSRRITKANENQWLDFELGNLRVDKDSYYGFKLECKGGGMLAVAECPWSVQNPYAEGEEWTGSSFTREGSFHKDFDLAFEGEIETSPNTQFI